MKVRSSLDCSDHKMLEFRILKGGNKEKSRIMTVVQRCAWKNPIGYSPGEKRDPGEGSPTSSRMVLPNKQNIKQRRPAWKTDLLTKVKRKQDMHRRWKEGHVTQENYRDTVQASKRWD